MMPPLLSLQPTLSDPPRTDAPDLTRLAARFPAADVEWKVIESSVRDNKPIVSVAPFLDARSIMERLDQIVGPGGWTTDVKAAPNSLDGVVYGLSLCLNGQWITKYDGADIPPLTGGRQADRTKSALTMGLRRAAMLWGVGRYLWALPKRMRPVIGPSYSAATPNFHDIKGKGQGSPSLMKIWWGPPALPLWALPPVASEGTPPATPQLVADGADVGAGTPPPVSGGSALRCPACRSTMWDNRAENAERNAADEKAGRPRRAARPDFKCRNTDCQCRVFANEYDLSTGRLTPDARARLELDEELDEEE